MRMLDLILKKKRGLALSHEEICYFVQGITHHTIPDYQTAAFLMAVCFQHMNADETTALTEAMVASGETIDLTEIQGIKVDKHSTGGVGDKTTIALGPLVAACGVPVAKMSGRGLGHTGGTIDKLESIPGFQTDLPIRHFIQQVNRYKLAVAGQTANLAPADKILYALRDVTGTVEDISLIASSVMSKKLASGADAIVLDVKTGSGAFMKSREEAVELGKAMVSIGNRMNRKTVALVTDMNQPLGYGVGNSLEVKEAIELLHHQGPADLEELCLHLGGWMLVLGEKAASLEEGMNQILHSIESGSGLDAMVAFVEAQGGDSRYVKDPALFPAAEETVHVKADTTGFVRLINAEEVGRSALLLGAGREHKESRIDLSVGVMLHKKTGYRVSAGETLAVVHSNDPDKTKEAVEVLAAAYEVGKEEPEKRPLIMELISDQA